MYTRRKFVIQGSLATTAVLALDPFKSAASIISNFGSLESGNRKLTFLHTTHPDSQYNSGLMQHIAGLKNTHANAIVLQAGQESNKQTPMIGYDFCINEINDQTALNGNYKIIRKGNIRTGIIIAKPDDADVIEKVNSLSAFLKKEKGCNVVVCVSHLGYKNKNKTDDITLAGQSNHLDIIIGGNADNFHKDPVVLLNHNKQEVIIHSTTGDAVSFGKIDIEFNEHGLKQGISFSNS